MFTVLLILSSIISSALSDIIPCGDTIDASFWAYDQGPNQVYIFSNDKYYLWDLKEHTLINQGNASKRWPDLPSNLDKACAIFDQSNSLNTNIFIKQDKVWIYENYELRYKKSLPQLFTTTIPNGDCITCNHIRDKTVGFTSIAKNNKYLAVTAKFSDGQFEEESFNGEKNERYKGASDKAGHCKALASSLDPLKNFQYFVYFGEKKIAISFDVDESKIKYESVGNLIDCQNFLFLHSIDEKIIYFVIAAVIIIFLMVMLTLLSKCCRRKQKEDVEKNLNEKPSPSVKSKLTEPRS